MTELWLDAPSEIISPGFDYLAVLSTGGAVLNGRGNAGGSLPAVPYLARYDVSMLGTMFQDAAGTVAAVVDSPVRRINDVSGNSLHAIAPSDAARPVLRNAGGVLSLQFDGVNDVLTADVVVPAYPARIFGAGYGTAAAGGGMLTLWQSNSIYKQLFCLDLTAWRIYNRGAGNSFNDESYASGLAHISASEFLSASTNLVMDGFDVAAAVSNTNVAGTTTKLHIGADFPGQQHFTGHFYGCGVVVEDIAILVRKSAEKWLANISGNQYDPLNYLLCEGDSNTWWTADGGSYARRLAATAPRFSGFVMQAVSGNTFANINARLATTQSNINIAIANGMRPIVTLLTGTNDYPGTTAAAQALYDAVAAYATTVRGYGAKFVICTAIATDPGTFADYEATGRPYFNSLIRGSSGVFDAIADFAADSRVNTWNGTHFQDIYHPSSAGHAVMLPIYQAAVASVRFAG